MYLAGPDGACKLRIKHRADKKPGRFLLVLKTSGAGFRKSRCGMEDCKVCGLFNSKYIQAIFNIQHARADVVANDYYIIPYSHI